MLMWDGAKVAIFSIQVLRTAVVTCSAQMRTAMVRDSAHTLPEMQLHALTQHTGFTTGSNMCLNMTTKVSTNYIQYTFFHQNTNSMLKLKSKINIYK